MNKINKYFLMGTVALSGMVGFSACSSDDASDDNGKTPAAENGVVKTQLAINVPKAGGTRQAGSTVQENGSDQFRGLANMKLFSLNVANDADNTVGEATINKVSDLANFEKNDMSSTQHKLYTNIDIPVNTNRFLLYAQAEENKTDENSTIENKYKYGCLKGSFSDSQVKGTTFALQTTLIGDMKAQKDEIVKRLNAIVDADGWKNATLPRYSQLLTQFSSLKAGSANAILLTVDALYRLVTPWSTSGEVLATKIKTAIEDNFVVDASADVSDNTKQIVTAFKDKGEGTITPNEDFPVQFNVPEGVATLSYNSGAFSFDTDPFIGGASSNKLSVKNIVYPASLYYFDNTDLRAVNQDIKTSDWPETLKDWESDGSFSGWDTKVNGDTRSIALKKSVNYGVALLKLGVKCSSSTLSQTDVTNPDGTVSSTQVTVPAEGFPVTGVLIGGQPSVVDWKFEPDHSGSDASFTYTVYDKSIADGNEASMVAKASEPNAYNYTMLLEDSKYDVKVAKGETNIQNDVYVVVEFKNTAADFQGYNGIVKKGQKFYLVAKVSPYGVNGSSNKWNGKDNTVVNPSIFMRDYQTVLTLTINSLKNAYTTIPDLRPSSLSLGLAVDLEWKDGFVFNDVNFE